MTVMRFIVLNFVMLKVFLGYRGLFPLPLSDVMCRATVAALWISCNVTYLLPVAPAVFVYYFVNKKRSCLW